MRTRTHTWPWPRLSPRVRSTLRRKRPADRLDVRKTYKLYVNGDFPRSESGRIYPIHDANGDLFSHADHSIQRIASVTVGTLLTLGIFATQIVNEGPGYINTVTGTGIQGFAQTWQEYTMDLPVSANGKNIVLQFRFVSDALEENWSGWYIDDVLVNEQ